ncbi:hypothetical protein CGRA01v4_07244 [Colletotrichum graminicola]|nr:hypothetical protein CGRA01v4_07244 [Colletotrichum graminicola]
MQSCIRKVSLRCSETVDTLSSDDGLWLDSSLPERRRQQGLVLRKWHHHEELVE